MARLVHVEGDQVRAACAAFEKLLAKDPTAQKERKEHEGWIRAEKARRDKEFAATQPKTRSTKKRVKK
jgi:predicted amidohydrolase YtcJ